jgi:hypothetical protein
MKDYNSYLKTGHELHVIRQAAELIVVQQQLVQFDMLQHMRGHLEKYSGVI